MNQKYQYNELIEVFETSGKINTAEKLPFDTIEFTYTDGEVNKTVNLQLTLGAYNDIRRRAFLDMPDKEIYQLYLLQEKTTLEKLARTKTNEYQAICSMLNNDSFNARLVKLKTNITEEIAILEA